MLYKHCRFIFVDNRYKMFYSSNYVPINLYCYGCLVTNSWKLHIHYYYKPLFFILLILILVCNNHIVEVLFCSRKVSSTSCLYMYIFITTIYPMRQPWHVICILSAGGDARRGHQPLNHCCGFPEYMHFS
jgi:hypothetical protein